MIGAIRAPILTRGRRNPRSIQDDVWDPGDLGTTTGDQEGTREGVGTMATGNTDPHAIEAVLTGEEEYQAPPREDAQSESEAGPFGRPEDESAEAIDINLLESQQQPGLQISETIAVDLREKKVFTVSGPDEETQPGGPRTVPPGESM
jgi:hypothetical protein